jgi:hypothetical protein
LFDQSNAFFEALAEARKNPMPLLIVSRRVEGDLQLVDLAAEGCQAMFDIVHRHAALSVSVTSVWQYMKANSVPRTSYLKALRNARSWLRRSPGISHAGVCS